MSKLSLATLVALASIIAYADVLNTTLFTKRIPITVSGYTGETTLTNFPVLVKLAKYDEENGTGVLGFRYADCALDGSDLRFADADGNPIPHEIELWKTNGESLVWVKLPSLSGTGTQFSLYYCTNGVDDLPAVDATNVWSRYAVVIHGGASIANAVGNGLAVSAGSSSVTASMSAGIAGGGIAKSTNKSIGLNVANPSASLYDNGQFSVSAWFKRNGNGGKNNNGTHILAASRSGWSNEDGFAILQEQGTHISVSYKGGHNWTTGSGSLTNQTWGHIAFAYDKPGAMLTAYFNGGLYQTKNNPTTLVNTSRANWTFGSFANTASDDSFKGDMDEIRVFNGVASGDWIKAEYDTVATPTSFAVCGAVTSADQYAPVLGDCSTLVVSNDVRFSVQIASLVAPANVSVFYSADGGETYSEFSLGSASSATTLVGVIPNMDVGSYVWYAKAVSTVSEVEHESLDVNSRYAFLVTRARDPASACKRIVATINYGGAAASDVPVLLRLSESGIEDFHYSDITSSGFEFLDEAGNMLPYEIDTWNEDGESLVWVRVHSFSNGEKLTIRYGGEFSNPPWRSSETWAGYAGVWHLNETNSASAYGSYPNSTAATGIDGEKAEAAIADEVGKIGKSVKTCDASRQGTGYQLGGVFVPDAGIDSPVDLGSKFTISGWFKHKNQDYYYDKLFGKRKATNNSGEPNGAFAIEIGAKDSANSVSALGGGNTTYTKVNFNSTLRNTWSYLTFVYDGAELRIYQNGTYCNGFAINPATDNDAPLCFGNLTGGYGNGTGDCAWCGWIDEVRLADCVPTAEWVAAEYAAMADESAFSFSRVTVVDAATPVLSVPTLLRNQDGSFTVTVDVSENVPASVVCTLGGTDYPMSSSDPELPKTYSVTVSDLPPGTYVANVTAESTTGNPVYAVYPTAFHAGALVVESIANADEGTLTPGAFRISRADADATGLPELTFDVAFSGDGLAAVVEPTVTTLTIPAGELSVETAITPVYAPAVTNDTTVVLVVSGASIGAPSSNSMTIVNADYDIAVRYVATATDGGNDANHGGTPELPKKTIASAVSSLANVAQSQPCVVYVAEGLYKISTPIVVNKAICVVGDDMDPSRVIVSNTVTGFNWGKSNRCFELNNAAAKISGFTLEKGMGYGSGGNLFINSNGGTASNCVIRSGLAREASQSGAGANVYVSGPGLVTHCAIFGGKFDQGGTTTGSSSVFLDNVNARLENCLVDGYRDQISAGTRRAAGVTVNKGRIVNCTVVNCYTTAETGGSFSGIRVESSGVATNCVSVKNVDGSQTLRAFLGQGSRTVNCAFDAIAGEAAIPEGMPNAVVGTAEDFFNDYANGDYTLNPTGVLVNAGIDYDDMASVDLAGKKRKIGKHIDLGCYECQKAPGFYIFVR